MPIPTSRRPVIAARLLTLIVGAAAAITLSMGSASAQAQNQKSITDALKGVATRTIGGGPVVDPAKAEAEKKLLDSVRNVPTRSIKVEAREQLAEIAKEKRGIDLEINFDYDSAAIGPRAVGAVTELGKALSDPEFRGKAFLLEGHTDAAGSAEYNLALSDRRAEAVKIYLVEKFKIPAEDLVAVGYGKARLKVPDGLAPENRRVRVVNLAVPK